MALLGHGPRLHRLQSLGNNKTSEQENFTTKLCCTLPRPLFCEVSASCSLTVQCLCVCAAVAQRATGFVVEGTRFVVCVFVLNVELCAVKLDNLVWTQSIEGQWRVDDIPEEAFVKRSGGVPLVPYSELYMFLIMQTMGFWMHFRELLPDVHVLQKGPLHTAEHCKSLLKATYTMAYDPARKVSVMTHLNPKLYDDAEWHTLQQQANPHWALDKQVRVVQSHVFVNTIPLL